jgi:hypothetical protein
MPKYDFQDGKGAVLAHQHSNGGGWVADTASVAATAKVSGYARVWREPVWSLVGPSYFTDSALFAKTYGKIAAFRLNLTKPLVLDNFGDWRQYADRPVIPLAAEVLSQGYDSVVLVTPKIIVVFVADPSVAELL